MFAVLVQNGQVEIPEEIRAAAGIEDGDAVEFTVVDGRVVLRPFKIDPDQAWFWTPEWQAKEREVDANLAAGRFERYHSTEEFFAALERVPASDDADV